MSGFRYPKYRFAEYLRVLTNKIRVLTNTIRLSRHESRVLLQAKADECETTAGLPMRLHALVALGATTVVGLAQWKLLPRRFRTVPLFNKLYDDRVPYSDVLVYVNGMGAGAYAVLAVTAAAIVYNLSQVVAGAVGTAAAAV